ncbi:FCS-Like Zinc finger 12 [Hirschfeldia incana]|nr:FCS-Like Zinc finger 12 [Hirschfeldia incana]
MVVPGYRSIISPGNFTTSPRSPLDMRLPSPGTSLKRYGDGGVGLGIVAALEKSGSVIRKEISSRQNSVYYSGPGSNRSNPVHCARRNQFEAEIELSEEYTCVTNRRDGVSKVYYKDDKFEFRDDRSEGDRRERRLDKSTETAEESAEKKRDVLRDSQEFLSLCCLCNKKLRGKDIYMYKGDRGFCSKECRSVRIMEDNIDAQHKSTTIEVLSSRCTGGQVSPTGIFVL